MAPHKVIKQSRKLIKPATATPSTLLHYKIGFIDEFAPALNIRLVLFFSVNNNQTPKFVSQLEKSLEKVLTRLYPLAGRYLQDIHVVDCNDQGVEFIQAQVNIKKQDIIGSEANLRLVNELMPSELGAVDQVNDPILSIKVTTFECEGLALGVSISHRIADAATLCTFLNEWAAVSREENEVGHIGSGFNSSSLFPGRGLPPVQQGLPRSISDDELRKNVTKKLTYSENEILNLKEKIMLNRQNGSPQWSKVQLVSAIVWNAFITIDRKIHDKPRESILLQPINLRGKTTSLIPNDSCGNLWGLLATKCKSSVETIEALADLLTDSVKNTKDYYFKVHHDNEEGQKMVLNSFSYLATIPPTTNVISFSSWCKFPFYEADFGFGKPVWVNCGSMPAKNSAYLIDGVGGNGIEAYLCVEDKDIPYLEEALHINTLVA